MRTTLLALLLAAPASAQDEKRKERVLLSTGRTGTVQVPSRDGNSC